MAGRLTVEVQIECPAWRKAWPRARTEIRALLAAAVRDPAVGPVKGQVVVVLSDDRRLAALNKRFRGKDRPTNVLSFNDPASPPGGLAVAFETVAAEASDQGKRHVNHSKHLILHGFLHLLGYDHEAPKARRLMEGREIAILKAMGIPNPYFIGTKTRA